MELAEKEGFGSFHFLAGGTWRLTGMRRRLPTEKMNLTRSKRCWLVYTRCARESKMEISVKTLAFQITRYWEVARPPFRT